MIHNMYVFRDLILDRASTTKTVSLFWESEVATGIDVNHWIVFADGR